jgi:hypothetical protein
MPAIMRDEMTGPMARQRVNIITHKQVRGYGLGQPRGWGLISLGFTHIDLTYKQTNTRELDPTQ